MGKIMDAVKNKMQSWLEIRDNTPRAIVVNRNEDLQIYFAKNKIWYIGEANELEDFYKQIDGKETSFWGSVPTSGLEIKKIHSGLPKKIIDKLTDIVIDNYNGVEIEDDVKLKEWETIAKDNNFDKLLWKMVNQTLALGDGAIRYSYDEEISDYPILEWFPGNMIDVIYKRDRLYEIVFKTWYEKDNKKYLLKEHRGWGYVTYELYDNDRLVPLNTIDSLNKLKNISFDKKVMWAELFKVDDNSKYPGRGASKFDGKYDAFDSLDEILSQWIEAIRLGKAVKYIPEKLMPRDADNGALLPNSFDNQYILTDSDMSQESKNEIKVIQPDIPTDKYYQSYVTYLELCMQGLISPATLGIDTKKIQDPNSSYERQMEKTTLYTRQGIIEALNEFIPKVINGVLKSYEQMQHKKPSEDIEISVNFGEYDSPSFDSQIETITKAKIGGIMSLETSVKELYGDSKDDDWINEEILRLKEEQGITEMEEPSINEDLDLFGDESEKPKEEKKETNKDELNSENSEKAELKIKEKEEIKEVEKKKE